MTPLFFRRKRRAVNVFWSLDGTAVLIHYGRESWSGFNKAIKFIERNLFWFSLRLLSEIFLILITIQRYIIIIAHTSSCNVPVIIVIFNRTWIFGTGFRIIFSYQISWKSVQWEPSCSMRTDGQADMTKYLFAFRDFANAPVWFIINVSDIFKFVLFLSTLPTFFWFYLALDAVYLFIL